MPISIICGVYFNVYIFIALSNMNMISFYVAVNENFKGIFHQKVISSIILH